MSTRTTTNEVELSSLMWLRRLLKTKFYGTCRKHGTKKCNFFCKDCTDSPLCNCCMSSSECVHKGHQILQVYKASEHAGIKTGVISAFMDVNDIQQYIINHNSIVYINPRPLKGSGSQQCRNCGGDNQKEHKFCSIACKVAHTSASNSNKRIRLDAEVHHNSTPTRMESNQHQLSTTRRRKGIPKRSPLF